VIDGFWRRVEAVPIDLIAIYRSTFELFPRNGIENRDERDF
jgi:hypothetical protein